VLLPVAVAALLAGGFGIFLAGRVTGRAVLIVDRGRRGDRALPARLDRRSSGVWHGGRDRVIGAFTATFALPRSRSFGHGFVLSALPAVGAVSRSRPRLVAGMASAIVCIPAVIELFENPPAGRCLEARFER